MVELMTDKGTPEQLWLGRRGSGQTWLNDCSVTRKVRKTGGWGQALPLLHSQS